MTQAADLPGLASEAAEGTSLRKFLAGTFVVSFASLLLELALTRLFSVVLYYHFAFMAISVALLGLGAGGVFAYTQREWLSRWPTQTLAVRLCLFNAIAIFLLLQTVLQAPFFFGITPLARPSLLIMYLAAVVPFFFTGLLFSLVFARVSRRISQLYAADLIGGATACLTVVPLLNVLGAPNGIVFAALAMAAASIIWANGWRPRAGGLMLVTLLALLLVANRSGRLIDVRYAKGARLYQPSREYVEWNALSLVEVVVDNGDSKKMIVIDADANTEIASVAPQAWEGTSLQKRLMSTSSAVANVLRPQGDFAIIGPGGGMDVLLAVANGSENVTGIEINPIIVNDIMRDRYAEYSHYLYEMPEVRIHVGDGRSWIRRSRDRFDVVQMTLVDTWASTSAGALALTENYLYTVEAFREYFEHLKADGLVAVTRWEFTEPREALRVVSLAMEALHNLGVADTQRHFVVVSQRQLGKYGSLVTVLAKKSPFTEEEETILHAHFAARPNLVSLFMPSDLASLAAEATVVTAVPNPSAFRALIASNDAQAFAKAYPYNVAPVTDDSPFFFFTLKTGQVLDQWIRQTGESKDWKVNLGVLLLLQALAVSILAVVAFLILPLLRRRTGTRPRRLPLLYFVAVGLGYILVEITFIQRFVLFLGHPTYALTVAVFLLLLSSGIGSVMARRWLSEPMGLRVPLATIVAATSVYALLLPHILTPLVDLAFSQKLLISTAILVPLGFVMGMPFPTGLWALARSGEQTVEWAFAMNAAATVLGSVLAMIIAMHFGLSITLACGAAAYLLAAGLIGTLPDAGNAAV